MHPIRLLLLVLVSLNGFADSTFAVRTVFRDRWEHGSMHTDVYYRKGLLRRKESLGGNGAAVWALIANCETREGLSVDLSTNQVRHYQLSAILSAVEYEALLRRNPKNVVTIQSSTRDTGETKIFFGHSARHLITTLRRIDDNPGEEIVDGWYIDYDQPDANCAPPDRNSNLWLLIPTTLVKFPEIAKYQHKGPLPTGLAIQETITLRTPKTGKTSVDRVVERLSYETLGSELFDLPRGAKRGQNFLEGAPR